MKTTRDKFITSVLGGIGITALGICLFVFPMLAHMSTEPRGVASLLVGLGRLLCFGFLADSSVFAVPEVLCFPLAVAFWFGIIFVIQTMIARRSL